jgi:hypothetical protein
MLVLHNCDSSSIRHTFIFCRTFNRARITIVIYASVSVSSQVKLRPCKVFKFRCRQIFKRSYNIDENSTFFCLSVAVLLSHKLISTTSRSWCESECSCRSSRIMCNIYKFFCLWIDCCIDIGIIAVNVPGWAWPGLTMQTALHSPAVQDRIYFHYSH